MRRPLLSGRPIISLLAVVLTTTLAPAATLLRGPYLQAATPTSVVVRWRTDVPDKSFIEFGPVPGELAQTAASDTPAADHVVELSPLKPDTKYYYSIVEGSTTLAGGADYFLITPPVAGPAHPVRFWVLGDPGTGDAKAKAVRDAYEHFTAGKPTDFCLLLGDNAYPDGTDKEYQEGFFDIYPSMLRHAILWPALGNHDSHSAKSQTQSGPYFDIFTVPTKGEAGGLASGTKAYYSFDHANIHLISLDTSDSNREPDGPMLRWLKADMAATKQEWIIAFFHHPPYSKGNHDSDEINGNRDLFEVRQQVLPVLEAGGVDLILAGHSHVYERSRFLDGYYGMSADFSEKLYVKQAGDGRPEGNGAYRKPLARTPHAGEVIVVAGSSGKVPTPDKAPLHHPAMVTSFRETGSLIVEVNGDRIDVTFLNGGSTVRDTFRLEKK
jgi:3',5'-cyclic AMP phosphodiesterase CpdA